MILSKTLHWISQSLLIPVIISLWIFLLWSLVELGSFIVESIRRKKIPADRLITYFKDMSDFDALEKFIEESKLPRNGKQILIKLYQNKDIPETSLIALKKKLIEAEEIRATKVLEKTDIIAKLGPLVGLMGTLIPLGPGLMAMANGDMKLLAESVSVAFDNTVVGMGAAGISSVISKVRRRWYEEYLSTIDEIANLFTEVLINEKEKQYNIKA
ncbi:MotA/TolQ/ExbB proton channel family protein [Aceticella autotrophica]|uniref:MotA/TolQ/ExbB proton channel family protein n=1 Tax=Aceticella autotrophica TaxID=2755338 RepID=A0A975AXC6_9THEO|nr:MotA/TolQ/ExbB proton channel family protein [Aceticella autotrophica]QSZ28192.1 MotA/TolQ/ExbB proton channel family protein [Aceticella autotrophica]